MSDSSFKRVVQCLGGLILVLSFCCLPGEAQTRRRPSRSQRSGARSLVGIPGPTKPTPYWCEFQLNNNNNGTANVTFEFTRQMPNNGWLAIIHNRYEKNGGTLDQNVQLYNPQPMYNKPRLPSVPPKQIGTQWDFQTTDGRITCKVSITKDGGEVRFSNCSNGAQQYCITQRVVDAVAESKCNQCGSVTGAGRGPCFVKCLNNGGANWDVNPMDCEQFPVSCFSFLVIRFTPTDFFTGVLRTKYDDALTVLDLMHGEWINFVNGALGPCTTSTYCPGGTFCTAGGSCQEIFKK